MVLFKTFRMQKDDISYLCVGVLEQGDMQKVVSEGWCKESRGFYNNKMNHKSADETEDAQTDLHVYFLNMLK